MDTDPYAWKDTLTVVDDRLRRAWLSDLRPQVQRAVGNAVPAKANRKAARVATPHVAGLTRLTAALYALPWGKLDLIRWFKGLHPTVQWRFKRLAQGLALASGASLAVAGTVVVMAYQEKSTEDWAAALAAGEMVPILSSSGALLGGTPAKSTSGLDYQARGFLRDKGQDTPELFKAMVIALEDEHFGSWREVCGIDWLGLGPAWVQGRGASTLSMQIVKQALGTGNEAGLVALAIRKFKEVGYGAKLGCSLGKEGVLAAYIERVPLVAYGGTTRGLKASADAVFGRAPKELSPAQTAVLAAAALYNIREATQMPRPLREKGCAVTSDGSLTDEKALAAAQQHCRLIRRAKQAVLRTLSGERQAQALADLAGMEHGLVFANPWQPLSTKRAANMSMRAVGLLPQPVLSELRSGIDVAGDLSPEGFVVNLSDDHARFVLATQSALRDVERANSTSLCSKLTQKGPVLPCANAPLGLAETVLIKADVTTGAIKRLYSTYADGPGRAMGMGSIAKLISALAAVRAGMGPGTPVCARQAMRNGQPLLRVTRPREGYTNCSQAGATISLEEAFKTSDSLALYELNKRLGEPALSRAATDLGLSLPPAQSQRGTLGYQLGFGTFIASPLQMLELARRLGAAAYRWPMAGELSSVQRASRANTTRQIPLGLSADQSRALAGLLAAPVQPGGTMGWARDLAKAGKSGTTSAIAKPRPQARPYAAGKLSLLITKSGEVALSVVHQPDPPFALGVDSLPGGVFEPVMKALLQPHPVAPKP